MNDLKIEEYIRQYGVNRFGRDCPGTCTRTVKNFLGGESIQYETRAAFISFINENPRPKPRAFHNTQPKKEVHSIMADEKQTQEENASPYGYYVFNTTSGQPLCVLYATEAEAITEAKRLAVKHPGARIVICEVVGTVEIEAEHKRVFKDGTVI